MIDNVYKSRNNFVSLIFEEGEEFIPFTSATRMVLSFAGSSTVADTAVDSALIDCTTGQGIVNFYLKGIDLEINKLWPATLIVYDPSNNVNGKVLVHE